MTFPPRRTFRISSAPSARAPLGLAALTLFSVLYAAQAQAEGPQPRGRRGPPPEAFSACEGKKQGDECQVEFHDQTLDGVCETHDQDTPFCLPNDMPEPPAGGGPGGPRPPRE